MILLHLLRFAEFAVANYCGTLRALHVQQSHTDLLRELGLGLSRLTFGQLAWGFFEAAWVVAVTFGQLAISF